jgi:NADPH:quinone reductase-like Zn-dependent oxidoreductase
MFGPLRPKKQILGSDVAGQIEAVGRSVTRFRPGDEVFGDLSGTWGGFAEYVCAQEGALALKAPEMSFEQAAAIPQAALLALQSLRLMGPIREGQKLLINGAGGGVGTFAIQMVRQSGVEVTGVDRPEKFDMLRGMGVQHVIDYTREDFTRSGELYDRILDVKTTRSIFEYARALAPNGIYVTVGGSIARLVQSVLLRPWISMTRKKSIRFLALKLNEGLAEMKQLFEEGRVIPVIDGPWELAEVPEAFRHFGAGRHKGKVVITLK